MHSKMDFKICICLVIPGELEAFWNYKGFKGLFASENLFHSSLHHIFKSKTFRFPFSYKNSLTWGVKSEKN